MKLVRDNIPKIIQERGKEPKTHIATDKEYEEALIKKLKEELKEVEEDRNTEEIADLIEVAYALANKYGATEEEINKIRKEKNKKKSFKQVLKRTVALFIDRTF